MPDLKLVHGEAKERQPIALGIPRGATVHFDGAKRLVVLPARNEVLLDTFHVAIPMAVIKQLAAQVITLEANNELASQQQAPRPS